MVARRRSPGGYGSCGPSTPASPACSTASTAPDSVDRPRYWRRPGYGGRMRSEQRWLLTLSGRLDQARLDELRARLEMRRMGRLTDREDAHLGTREIPGGLVLDLWRDEDKQDDWS